MMRLPGAVGGGGSGYDHRGIGRLVNRIKLHAKGPDVHGSRRRLGYEDIPDGKGEVARGVEVNEDADPQRLVGVGPRVPPLGEHLQQVAKAKRGAAVILGCHELPP